MEHSARRAIEADCVALSYAFSYYIDHGKYAELSRLFAQDGVFIRLGVRLEGRAQILAALQRRPADQFTRHVTSNHHFTQVSDDVCTAVWYHATYYVFTDTRPPLTYDPQRVMLLDLYDTYTRTSDGWRFLERDSRIVMVPDDLRPRLPPEGLLPHD
jgi:SnoaL-like domain